MSKMSSKPIAIVIEEVLGIANAFIQGGTWRLTIPRKVVKQFGIDSKESSMEFIFLKTNRGILLVPLEKVVTPDTIRNAMG